MKVRIASVNEEHFSVCIKNNMWGANTTIVNKWEIGDILIFSVDKQIAAIAEIAGESYWDDKELWDNGLFWNRVPLKFQYILSPEDRIPVAGPIRDLLKKEWGENYGWGILNKTPLKQDTAKYIINEIHSRANALSFM